MLYWIILIIATAITSTVFYTKSRYTGTKKVLGLYSAQFFNLFIGMPIVMVSVINIVLGVASRPEVQNLFTSTSVILSFIIASLISTGIGIAIHSTSTSVYEAFQKSEHNDKAYLTNEVFHKYLSHEFANVGAICLIIFIGILEVNHPAPNPIFSLGIAELFGLLIGAITSFSIIQGTYVGLSLLTSFWRSLLMSVAMFPIYGFENLQNHPLSVAMLTSVTLIFILLLLFSLAILFTEGPKKKLIKILFPKEHQVRKLFHM